MKVRICPYCDHEMNKKHRCGTCGAFVWKAQEQDIHFNSESRGKGEIDCAYAEAHDAVHHTKPKTKNTASLKAAIIVVFVVIVAVFLSICYFVVKVSSPEMNSFVSDIFTKDVVDEDYETMTQEIVAQEDALAEGKHCTGYGHMDIKKEELVFQIESFLSDNHVNYDEVDELFENTRSSWGGTSESEITYYKGEVTFNVDSETIDYICVNYDSVTGEVHELTLFYTGSEKKAQKLLIYCMNWLEKGYGTEHSDDLSDCFNMTDDHSFTDVGEYSIYVSENEYKGINQYYFSIGALY